MTITTSFPTSYKTELFYAGHCSGGNVATTGTLVSGSAVISALTSPVGIAVGMYATDTGNTSIPANTVVASIDSASQITLSKVATGSHAPTQLAFNGDTFFIVLIKSSPAGTYGTGTVNYTDVTGNADEVSGAGYTTGGQVLVNVSPAVSGTTAFITYNINPTWTSATFSTDGCIIYNSKARLGGTSGTNTQGANRVIYVGSFGGTQTVSAGTFTAVLPVANASLALIRI